MEVDRERIKELVQRPGESLSVELKRWISPDVPAGISKIVRTVLALRNHGGGYLVIGFDNDTLQPDTTNAPPDVKSVFHIDIIQAMVAKYASEPFEISVEFAERDGQIHPVIVVPQGVKTPVAAKADLKVADVKLISSDDVYIRSLQANNTASTARANWKDWSRIVEVCFDNREADIGRFMRRHLSGLTPEVVQQLLGAVQNAPAELTTKQMVCALLDEGESRYLTVLQERAAVLPQHGSWEVALRFVGLVPSHSANRDFLNLLEASNPDYTGWPVWLDSRNFQDKADKPYVVNGVWEAFVISLNTGWSDHVDFMRLDPAGRFYLRRALQDDISGSAQAPQPLTALDFGLSVLRTAEALAVGIAFAKAMGCDTEGTLLGFAFRWKGLLGRQIASWANPDRYVSPGRTPYQDELVSYVEVPLETPLSALPTYVAQVVKPLFEVFDGFVLGDSVIDDLTRRLIEHRL